MHNMASKSLLFQVICRKHSLNNIQSCCQVTSTLLQAGCVSTVQVRGKRSPAYYVRPSIRRPWHVRKWSEKQDENLTSINEEFVQEVLQDKYKTPSPLKDEPWERNPYIVGTRRTGVLALKLGTMLQWTKDGKSVLVTLLQVLDNHVINYVPPELYSSYPSHQPHHRDRFGLQVVGALSCDPRIFSKPYNNLFIKAGVPPKRWLTRFLVTPNAAVQPGTPLNVSHFKIGNYVDVQARTRDFGFQGVIKRWGMKGMPASHGVTKAHRKMGSTGGGGDKDGIWKGKRMPGIMGNKLRSTFGLKILRINTKYNVLYVRGTVAGSPHTFARVSDSVLPTRRLQEGAHIPMPTFLPEDEEEEDIPEEIFDDNLYQFTEPSIEVQPES